MKETNTNSKFDANTHKVDQQKDPREDVNPIIMQKLLPMMKTGGKGNGNMPKNVDANKVNVQMQMDTLRACLGHDVIIVGSIL